MPPGRASVKAQKAPGRTVRGHRTFQRGSETKPITCASPLDGKRPERVGRHVLMPSVLDERAKFIKKIARIVRARRGFGMVLHAENGVLPVTHPFHRAVIQVYV